MPIKNNQINLFILLVFGTNLIFTKEKKHFYTTIHLIPQIFQELTANFQKKKIITHNQLI